MVRPRRASTAKVRKSRQLRSRPIGPWNWRGAALRPPHQHRFPCWPSASLHAVSQTPPEPLAALAAPPLVPLYTLKPAPDRVRPYSSDVPAGAAAALEDEVATGAGPVDASATAAAAANLALRVADRVRPKTGRDAAAGASVLPEEVTGTRGGGSANRGALLALGALLVRASVGCTSKRRQSRSVGTVVLLGKQRASSAALGRDDGIWSCPVIWICSLT